MKFVTEFDGNPTKREVYDYMRSAAVPAEFRTSWVTSLSLIDELDGDRLTVTKGERRGQSHFLSINNQSRFDLISKHLSEIAKQIEKLDEDKPEMVLPLKKGGTLSMPSHITPLLGLCLLAVRVTRDIKNKDDVALLNDKILQLMVNMGLKNIAQLRKKFGRYWSDI